MADHPRNPERAIERIRNRSEHRIRGWRRNLETRIGKERDRRRERIEAIRASLDATSTSDAGVRMVADFEGFVDHAYKPDPGEQYWTIGFGHYGPDVKPGDRITRDRALVLLDDDLAWAERAVRDRVRVDLSQHQFDALASFVFNIGAGAFASSTLLRRLNNGEYAAVPGELRRWVNGASGPLPGLVRRRDAEGTLFRTGNYPN